MIKRIKMSISDPWEIGEELEWPTFFGELHFEEDSSQGVFYLCDPINYQQVTYPVAVVYCRHGNLASKDFDVQRIIPCSVICVPSEKSITPIRFAQTWRGGGLTFIGSIMSMANEQV